MGSIVDYKKSIPAVQRAISGGASIRATARDHGIPEGTIRHWILSGKVVPPAPGPGCQNGNPGGNEYNNSTIVEKNYDSTQISQIEPLSEEDRTDYERLKAAMTEARDAWFKAALEIRDRGLYREDYATFEDFLKGWGASGRSSRFYQLIEAQKVGDNLVAAGLPAPARESHARPLASLPPEKQVEAAKAARQESGGNPTAKDYERAAAKVSGRPAPSRNGHPEATIPAGPPEPEPAVKVETVVTDGPEDGEAADPVLDDAAWVEQFEVRRHLTDGCRERFDHDAVAFRRLEPLVEAFAKDARPLLKKLKRENGYQGSYQNRVVWFLKTEHPKYWRACPDCKTDGGLSAGEVRLVGRCPSCKGGGYVL